MTKLPYLLASIIVVAGVCFISIAWRHNVRQTAGSMSAVDDSLPSGPPAELLTRFTLDERGGQPIDSEAFLGKVWVASFFFTTCPGSCVRLNQAVKSLHDDDSFGDVRFVSISCDPDTDTLELLGEYADRFGADPQRWLFCRGHLDYVQRVGRDMMQLSVNRQTHSDRAVVIDRAGNVRARFVVTDPNQLLRMKQLLATCLQEPAVESQQGDTDVPVELTRIQQPGQNESTEL